MSTKLIIIGSGPAGYTAAIYAARANLEPILFEGARLPGGQLMTTTEVENFPGFPKGILGPELMQVMRVQAERFGTIIKSEDVTVVDFRGRLFKIKTSSAEYDTDAVIIATGSEARRLGLESEKKLYGKGVSACATCDGYFFKEKEVVVVGGGDGAMEEATFLTKFAKHVTVIHRRESLRASQIMQDRARANPKISFIFNTEVKEIIGEDVGHVTGVKLFNNQTNETKDFLCDGVFAAIGHDPATELFKGQIELDAKSYIITQNCTSKTSVEGVFAAGDVADPWYRQAITSAGMGAKAAIDVEKYFGGRD